MIKQHAIVNLSYFWAGFWVNVISQHAIMVNYPQFAPILPFKKCFCRGVLSTPYKVSAININLLPHQQAIHTSELVCLCHKYS
ncbi:Uncharacterised protein [Moraxella lacunata]|uniref:Uncharacterized protein n=1 Tax=Moraxella lacunata TaxID=477 RepID=A0A378TSW2_MORLA|nr:Uncharacterised protein [Moraxella lacunata]